MNLHSSFFTLPCALLLLLGFALPVPRANAQEQRPSPIALPEPVTPPTATVPPAPDVATPAVPAAAPSIAPAPAIAAPAIVPAPAPTSLEATTRSQPPAPGEGILMNFQGAALSDVLNYLSEAAGFVIVQEAPVSGTVNIVSKQPLTPDDAVDLVNAVLIEKGFVALRNGRILKIVSRQGAQKRDLPVLTGSNPELIPRKDDMVTQILPLRFGEAAKLVENLQPLLAENATISANDASNAILLTDTQTNIRRVAQIIRALDTSVAGASTIRIFQLQFADAKQLATVVTQLFATTATGAGDQGRRGGGDRGGGGRGGGGGGGTNEARAAARVIAVADEQSNSLIVSAPDEVMPTIEDLVTRTDTSITDVTDTRIFRLLHADAAELAIIITSLYGDLGTTNTGGGGRPADAGGGDPRQRFRDFFGGGGGGGGRGQQPQTSPAQQSSRSLLQTRVVAVGDPRTNSLIVTAARDTMAQVAEMVGRLDATDAKKQRVYIHSLEHADADGVANLLRGMLGDTSAATTAAQSGTSRLTERTATGASIDASGASNTTGGGAARGTR